MKRTFLILSALFQTAVILAPVAIYAKGDSVLLGGLEQPMQITINNRILAKVHGKAISVIDVMKKMDMLFYKQFPQYTSSVEARFQFYQVQWKRTLQDLVDKELILADAEESKIQVTANETRKEMESQFGPNIILNLDKVGLTFDEAWHMVQGDLLLRRMITFRVNSKAFKIVTPQVIRTAYEQFAKENIRTPEWHYYVITIRDPDSTKAADAANLVHELLVNDAVSLEELPNKLKSMGPVIAQSVKVNISEEYKHNEKSVSPANKEILVTLQQGSYSQPVAQKSRADKSIVFRIFSLKEMKEGGSVPFSEVERKLENQLLDKAIDKESELYLKKLRQHYNYSEIQSQDIVEESFQPFSLTKG